MVAIGVSIAVLILAVLLVRSLAARVRRGRDKSVVEFGSSWKEFQASKGGL
jgi:hypothetical protein